MRIHFSINSECWGLWSSSRARIQKLPIGVHFVYAHRLHGCCLFSSSYWRLRAARLENKCKNYYIEYNIYSVQKCDQYMPRLNGRHSSRSIPLAIFFAALTPKCHKAFKMSGSLSQRIRIPSAQFRSRRSFSASPMAAATEVKRLGVVGAGQMVRRQSLLI